jgi:hypothetical protein
MRRALLIVAVAVTGCGGSSTYAGLSRDEASQRAQDAFAVAMAGTALRSKIDALVEDDADGSMGRAGGSTPGITRLDVKSLDTAVERDSVSGRDAWLARFEIRANNNHLEVCAYVWDDGSFVTAKREC